MYRPIGLPIIGLKWQGSTYIDVALAFGFKNGTAACQLCTDVITNMLRHQKIWLMNYLDDYIGIAQPHQAEGNFQSLLNILDQVGLPVNNNKVEPPSSVVTCLGIQINAKEGILLVPDSIKLPGYFFHYVRWFHRFLDKFNGSVEIHSKNVKIFNVFVDASLQHTGGIYDNKVYSCEIPQVLK